jgi:hypothetical protein
MLKESENTKQIPGESYRRWFSDKTCDLIVWYSTDKNIIGFQFCYQEDSFERALTWFEDSGYSHNRVDSGEGISLQHKMTPILIPDGTFDKENVLRLFKKKSKAIDQEVARFVSKIIKNYPR